MLRRVPPVCSKPRPVPACRQTGAGSFTQDCIVNFIRLRRKPQVCLGMNAERVSFEALKERSRVCFGGFRPSEACGAATALASEVPLL